MKKLFCKFIYIFLISILFLSCKNIFNASSENPVNEKSAYLCISDSQLLSRTINPEIKLSDFTYFELSGRFSTGEEKILGTWTSYSAFANSKVNVAIGVWDFYLKAQTYENSNTVYKGKLLNKNIVNGANEISFKLYPYTYSMNDKGAFDIIVTLPDSTVTHARARLESFDSESGTFLSASEEKVIMLSQGSIENVTKNMIAFSGTQTDSGIYNAVITLYKDEVELNTVTSLVNIVDGFVSSGLIEIDDLENLYTITFELNGASWASPSVIPSIYSRKTEIVLPDSEAIFLDGYTFGGWYTSPVAKETPATLGQKTPFEGSITSVSKGNTGNKTFYAFFTLNSYPVLFMANGGTGAMGVQEYVYTASKNLNANQFTKTGYHFKCWNKNADGSGTNYSDCTSFTMPLNGIILYAIWEANTYTVVFNANGGTGTMQSQTMTWDESAVLNANAFSRTGYRFTGWSTSPDGGVVYTDKASVINLTSELAATVKLYAQWAYWLQAGDIVLKDGTIRRNSSNTNNAVAVIFKATTETEPALGFAILSDEMQNRAYKWAKNTNTNFSTIGDGSANWGIICETDPEGTLDAQTNYPAFYAVNNFANLQDTGIYTYGWYIPSTAEAQMIFDQFAENGNFLSDRMNFWTSSSKTKAEAYYAYHEYDDGWNYDTSYTNKTDTSCILPVRAFGEEYNIDYQFNGGFAPENFPLKHTAGSATSLARPIRYGFKFEGWYTDFAFTNPIYYIPSDASSITLYAKWTACLSVGDVILKDGTVILYNKVNTMTNEQKKNAVAVIFKANEGDTPAFGVGLKTDYLKWSSNTNNNFATSDTDGRLNWKVVRQTDTAGSADPAANYPAFNYALNYSSKYDTGIYNGGWYIPSKGEAYTIADLFSSKGAFYQASYNAGLDLADVSFWSSSNRNNASAWYYGISYDNEDDSMTVSEGYGNKTSPWNTLVVRPFGVGHKITYVLNGGTLADGAPTEHMPGSETYLASPNRTEYCFVAWYTNSNLTGDPKIYIEPEETGVTLYAKWDLLYLNANNVASYIRSMQESSTVRVAGPVDTTTIEEIRQALKDLCSRDSSIQVSLNLSSITGLTAIPENAFSECYNLKSINIPSTITKIEKNAFYNCSELKTVSFNGTIKQWCSINFSGDASNPCRYGNADLYIGEQPIKNLIIPDDVKRINDYAFSGCGSLTSITIPESVTYLGRHVFCTCPKLADVTILCNISLIFEYTFFTCVNLKKITIPYSVKKINEYAFYNCIRLKDVYYAGTMPTSYSISLASGNTYFNSATKHYNYTE